MERKPSLRLSATKWRLNKHSDEETQHVLDRRKAHGLTVVQLFAAWTWTSPQSCELKWSHTDSAGNPPFFNGQPTQINPEYLRRWLRIAGQAAARGLLTGDDDRSRSPLRRPQG